MKAITLCLASTFQNGVRSFLNASAKLLLYLDLTFFCKKLRAKDLSLSLSATLSSGTAKFGYLPKTLIILSVGMLTWKLSITLLIITGVILSCNNAR